MSVLLIIGIVVLSLMLLVAFLLSLRGTLNIKYNGELFISLRVLFVKIRLYPKKDKKRRRQSMSAREAKRIRRAVRKRALKEKERELERKREKAIAKAKKKEEQKKKTVSEKISDGVETVKLIADLATGAVKRFTKRIKVKITRLKITVASSEASKTAIAYGAIVETVNTLLPVMTESKNFKMPPREDLDVVADFTSQTPEFDIDISLSLRAWHVLDIALGALLKGLPRLKKRNQKKATAGHKVK
ncbi:MAG: hypothetical protein E7607_07215 [Ruminococcaceae bacterium]|nr:hypothetical protein [Oscillospiraceae bacterium]